MTVPLRPRLPPGGSALARSGAVAILLYVFLLGVNGLSEGFKLLGGDVVETIFTTTANPFVSLIVGLLATTLVQSSSVTTSMIVALVAAPENPLPLVHAIPMIMGANIGTTVTATLVSLAHASRREEFERAFPVAICHDLFNYVAVLVLLPLELTTGYLRHTAIRLASMLDGLGGVTYESPLRDALRGGVTPVAAMATRLFQSAQGQSLFLIVVSALFIFLALALLVRVLRTAIHARVEVLVTNVLGSSAIVSMLAGVIVTVMVQSSSITTSLLVPLGGAGLLKLEQAFPITIGANIGTTVTALLAALAVTGPHAGVGLEIALVHLLFNLSGMLLIYPAKGIRSIPLGAARGLTKLALRSRKQTVAWIALLFYGLPALVLLLDRLVG